jgi:hypothetical protein
MASEAFTIQTLNDGPRNTTLKIDGFVNGEDYTNQLVVNPTTLSRIDAFNTPTKVRVTRINFDIEDGLDCNLVWDSNSGTGGQADLWRCTGRGEIKGKPFGGFTDNATNPNYNIVLNTIGGTASSIPLSFTIVLELIKS